jgi:lipoprotein-releasing system ATP-binding protein
MSDVIVSCEGLCKSYLDVKNRVDVLKDVDLKICSGDLISVMGPSGSGKSTLLHLLGGLDLATTGRVLAKGYDWQKLTEKTRCQLRNRTFGFVYQFHHLLPEFTALENVAFPLRIASESRQLAYEKAADILKEVGLGKRMDHKPAQLSGGERQRVAIARALVHRPACVFADEPTGNLDEATAKHVFELMMELNQRYRTALVMVTHDVKLAQGMSRQFYLTNGSLSVVSATSSMV